MVMLAVVLLINACSSPSPKPGLIHPIPVSIRSGLAAGVLDRHLDGQVIGTTAPLRAWTGSDRAND